MRKKLASFLCATLLFASALSAASASNFYLIADSDTRELTRDELWEWQYEALGYILNEIFARHGYHFIPGQKYDNYFRAQTWYRENEQYDSNQGIYKRLMTDVEWRNERLGEGHARGKCARWARRTPRESPCRPCPMSRRSTAHSPPSFRWPFRPTSV